MDLSIFYMYPLVDMLFGSEGDDTLNGGNGADNFSCGGGTDTIADFSTQADVKSDNCEVY